MLFDAKTIIICLLILSVAIRPAKPFTVLNNDGGRKVFEARRRESTTTTTTSLNAIAAASVCKHQLLNLVSETPSGTPTSRSMTKTILQLIQQLEIKCPTPDDKVLPSLQGSWELLWTTQDPAAPESRRPFFQSWINPLENQSYSNNPSGRANPFLPVPIQDRLEKLGLVSGTPVRSTQAIDLKNGVIRNIVSLNFGRSNSQRGNLSTLIATSSSGDVEQGNNGQTLSTQQYNGRTFDTNNKSIVPTRASLTVSVGFKPVPSDPRRVDVKFDRFRFNVPGTPVDWEIPLGLAGPTGWLRTVYIDDDLRISRGHKGSVFVLSRPRRATV